MWNRHIINFFLCAASVQKHVFLISFRNKTRKPPESFTVFVLMAYILFRSSELNGFHLSSPHTDFLLVFNTSSVLLPNSLTHSIKTALSRSAVAFLLSNWMAIFCLHLLNAMAVFDKVDLFFKFTNWLSCTQCRPREGGRITTHEYELYQSIVKITLKWITLSYIYNMLSFWFSVRKLKYLNKQFKTTLIKIMFLSYIRIFSFI